MMRPNGGVSRPVSLSSNSSHSQNAPMPISGRSGSVPGGRGQQRARNVTASMAPAAAGAHPRHGQHLQQQQRQQVPAFTHQNQQQQLQQPQQPHQPQAQQPLAHQPQAPQQQQQQQPRRSNPAATLQARCHRCFKPLASNFYLLKTCNCVFCEACTYGHFASNSTCPRCQKQASDSDFMDLEVPSEAVNRQEAKRAAVQYLYGNPTAPGTTVPLPQMATQLLDVVDHLKTATAVTLRQFSFEAVLQSSRVGQIQSAFDQQKQGFEQQKLGFEQQKQGFEQYKQEKESHLKQMQKLLDATNKELAEAHKEEWARRAQLPAGFAQPQAQQQYVRNSPMTGCTVTSVPMSSPGGGSTASAGSRSQHSGGKRGPSVPPGQEPPKKQALAAVRGNGWVGVGVGFGAVGRPTHPLQHVQPSAGSGMPASSASRRAMPVMTPIQLPGAPQPVPQQSHPPSSQPNGTTFTGASGHMFMQGVPPQRMTTSTAPMNAASQSGHRRAQQPAFASTYAQGGWNGSNRPHSNAGSLSSSSSFGSATGSRPAAFPSNARPGSINVPAPFPRGRQ